MSLRDALILAFGITGLLWYYVCLFALGFSASPQGKAAGDFRQFQSLSLTTISVSLATFVGMLLGIGTVSGKVQQEAARSGAAPLQITELTRTIMTSTLQWWCAGLYVLSLVIAIWFWYRDGDATDPAVSGLAKSLLGLMGGALSVVLGLPN